jgi:hypothetical protein
MLLELRRLVGQTENQEHQDRLNPLAHDLLQSVVSWALYKPRMACRGNLAGSIWKLVTDKPATQPLGDQSLLSAMLLTDLE